MSDDLRAAIEAWVDDLSAEIEELRDYLPPVAASRIAQIYRTAGLSDARDRLRAILAAPAPDTDALAERPVNQWAHVLDDMGSADFYDTEQDARQMRDLCGGGVDRVETYPVVPLGPAATPTQPAERIGTSPSSDGPVSFADERDTPTPSDAGEVGA